MHDAGHATVLPLDDKAVSAIEEAYLAQARGDAAAALRRAIGDALADLAEMERHSRLSSVCSREASCAARLTDARTDVRHKRHFSENDSAALLAAISECRRACIAAQTNATIGGPIYLTWMKSTSWLKHSPAIDVSFG